MWSAASHCPGSLEEPKTVMICLCPPSTTGSTRYFRHAALLVQPDLEILIDFVACQGSLSHRCPIYLTQPGNTLREPASSSRPSNISQCHKQASLIIFDSGSLEAPRGFDKVSYHLIMLQRSHVLFASVGRNVEKSEPSYTARGNVNRGSHCENQ